MLASVLGIVVCISAVCLLSSISSLADSLMLSFAKMISFGMPSVAIGERFEVLVLVCLIFLFCVMVL